MPSTSPCVFSFDVSVCFTLWSWTVSFVHLIKWREEIIGIWTFFSGLNTAVTATVIILLLEKQTWLKLTHRKHNEGMLVCSNGSWGFFLRFYLFLGRGRGRKRERNTHVWLPITCPLLGTWPTTQACALQWESNSRPFDSQADTQPLSHTSQGNFAPFFIYSCFFKEFIYF